MCIEALQFSGRFPLIKEKSFIVSKQTTFSIYKVLKTSNLAEKISLSGETNIFYLIIFAKMISQRYLANQLLENARMK